MARTLEELIILKRTALRYILARESRLLALGKKPVNKKISNFVRNHQESTTWSNFYDSLNEDLTRNINVYDWRFGEKRENRRRTFRLFSETKEVLIHRSLFLCGGKMEEAPIVRVSQGQLQGRLDSTPSGKAFYSFQGIPYATPPLGSLRFKAPQPIEPWEGVRDATAEGNVSSQIDPLFAKQYIGDENCLFLNVYTPNIDASLPVMIWTHGGAFKYGSGNTDMYGPDYLVEKDVVIVTVNYRLGALGFLSLDTEEIPGNAGLRDVVLALNWVKENISKFGGDAMNLTVFGESAGGALVSLLTASPLSKDLISKAIVQSGTALMDFAFQKKPVDNARALAKKLGFEGDNLEDMLEFLNSTTAKDIVEAQETFASESNPNIFTMVVEKEFPGVASVISEPFITLLTSGRVAHVPIMIGSTTLEFAFDKKFEDKDMIPETLNINDEDEVKAIAEDIKKQYFRDDEKLDSYKLMSDLFMNIDTHRYVNYLQHNINTPVYFYKFDYIGELNLSSKTYLNPLGLKLAMHFDELGYLFKNDFQKDQEPTDRDVKMRERMVRLWTNFAKSGNPTPDKTHYLPLTWQPVTKETIYYLNMGTELTLGTDYDGEKMAFWDDLYRKHFKIWDQSRHTNSTILITSDTTVEESESKIDVKSVDAPKVDEQGDAENQPDIANQQEIVEAPKIVEEAITVDDEPKAEAQLTAQEPEIIDAEPEIIDAQPEIIDAQPEIIDAQPEIINAQPEIVVAQPQIVDSQPDLVETVDEPPKIHDDLPKTNDVKKLVNSFKNLDTEVHINGGGVEKPKPRTSNEIKMVISNGAPKDVIRANDPPEDDLPKNIGVNKFVNFFESLGGKK